MDAFGQEGAAHLPQGHLVLGGTVPDLQDVVGGFCIKGQELYTVEPGEQSVQGKCYRTGGQFRWRKLKVESSLKILMAPSAST